MRPAILPYLALRLKPISIVALLTLLLCLSAPARLSAQTSDRIPAEIDSENLAVLPNHHPVWANEANSTGALPGNRTIDALTLVLSRSPQQEAAFQQLLAEQQTPGSPNYHHWLTAQQIGERFGLSAHDLASIQGWLQSQGLRVSFVTPSRMFIGFSGTAADLGRAFHTEFRSYSVMGKERISVASDPMIPASLLPVVKAVRGFFTIDEHPYVKARTMISPTPALNAGNGAHFLAPADFATIYDIPESLFGEGESIGIVGVSRTDFGDFDQFRQKTGTTFANPVEIVPKAYGGVDPGPAYTAPPASGVSIDGQLEATLDVTRAASIADGAQVKLVVATGASGGIGADAQYLIQTTPLPAQTMNISFGACEAEAGATNVAFWDTLFQQAAGEGISVFVASGDSGASECDTYFATPPATPVANSPNYICSSSYATCVGGTEFNDTANPSQYWSSSDSGVLGSALSYIPEGAWNEPLNSNGQTQAAATGGGVSTVIPTPSWQTGTGVPAARAGRYTPDIAFSASGHDGYFACFAAAGASCVSNSSGEFSFEYFFGTSGAAPDMAGIAALLDEKIGVAQGNLNPQLYPLAASAPSVFHDVTVASSGVSGCSVNTPSMCNNSIPSPTGLSGGQAGFLVGTGYDEVTGLGSLDVTNFLNSFATAPMIYLLINGSQIAFGVQTVGMQTTSSLGVENSGSTPLNPLTIKFSGSDAGDFSETDNCNVAIDPGASCTIQVAFTPTAVGARTAAMTLTSTNGANSPVSVSLSGTGTDSLPTPRVSVTVSSTTITTAQALTVTITVTAPSGSAANSGTITLAGGGYTSPATEVNGGTGLTTITIPAGVLAVGSDTITATYSGDSSLSGATATVAIQVSTPVPPSFAITGTAVTVTAGATSGNTSTITVAPAGGFTGTVALTAAVTSSPANATDTPTLSFGSTGSVAITGNTNGSGTLTITTMPEGTCPSAAGNGSAKGNSVSWLATGGITLAGLLLFGIPARNRRLRLFAILLCLGALAGGISACGGGGGGKSTCNVVTPGTTPGSYTITVTGTSGTLTSTGTVQLTVQ